MIFFNLNLLLNKAKTDQQIVEALYNSYIGKTIPKNLSDRSLIINGLKRGNSFLIDPESLFKSNATNTHISQYIKLAGRRSYSIYKEYGIKYLDISLYPDLNTNNIKHNYLLNILNNKLYFKYEEL